MRESSPETPASEDEIGARLQRYYDVEMAERRSRPLGPEREAHVRAFAQMLRATGAGPVLEIGCGAGRDGLVLAASGAEYIGIDLSRAGVQICRDLGLDAREASATELPLPDASVDAVWSMSTLMHLTDRQLLAALAEIRRVVRPGGQVALGMWGHQRRTVDVDGGGRYFNRRTDDELRAVLADLGDLAEFDTWDRSDGHHYQWALVQR